MKIQVKFKCHSVTTFEEGHKIVEMLMSEHGNEGIATTYNPEGKLTITIREESPNIDYFEAGEEYYLDFTSIIETE